MENGTPAWHQLFQHPSAKLHLYGKHAARPGRKMGHCNVLAPELSQALKTVERIRHDLFI